MSYAEFPSTYLHLEDGDHHELIEFYIEVRDKYTATLEAINRLEAEIKQYRADMQKEVSSAVELAVTRQLSNSLNEINNELNNMWSTIHLDERSITELQNTDKSLLTKIEILEADIVQTDQKISELKSEFDNKLSSLRNDTENKLNAIQIETNKKISDVDNKISDIYNAIDSEHSILSEEIVNGDNTILSKAQGYAYRLNVKTKTEIEKLVESMETTASAEAITWLWQYGCCHGGFTALEWYHLTNITCEDWQKVTPTAWEWYTMGKSMFRRFRRKNKMYSPVSGRFVDTRLALMELAYKLDVGNLSAEDYDTLGFTAEEYDAFKLTAVEYDWEGKEKLHVQ